jgi:iron complex transport system substrate-binding protein
LSTIVRKFFSTTVRKFFSTTVRKFFSTTVLIFFSTIVLFSVGAGCAPRKTAAGAREVTDGAGRKLRLGAVKRIVSLAPSSTEIVFALGAGGLLVGVDRYSNWPPEAEKVEKVGADIDPSLERILALKPDVVLTATSANTEATVQSISRLGLPVFVSTVATFDDVYRDIAGLGEALERRSEAAQLIASMKRRVAAVSERVRGKPAVRAAIVVWSEPLVVAGGKSHVGELLRAAGGMNVAADSPQPFPTYSLERMVERAPEVIIVGSHADVTPPLRPLEALVSIPAVKHKRVLLLDGDLLFRPGPRLPEGVEALGRALHPERDGGVP